MDTLRGRQGLVRSNYDILAHRGSYAKIIQMYVDGTKPVLFLGAELHSEALEMILQTLRLDYEVVTIPNGSQGPALEGKNYKVVGMGNANCLRENIFSIRQGERSAGYGIGINNEHLEKVRPYFKGLELENV